MWNGAAVSFAEPLIAASPHRVIYQIAQAARTHKENQQQFPRHAEFGESPQRSRGFLKSCAVLQEHDGCQIAGRQIMLSEQPCAGIGLEVGEQQVSIMIMTRQELRESVAQDANPVEQDDR